MESRDNKERLKNGEVKPSFSELHHALDVLLASFIDATGKVPSKTSVLDLLQWVNNKSKKNRYGIQSHQ